MTTSPATRSLDIVIAYRRAPVARLVAALCALAPAVAGRPAAAVRSPVPAQFEGVVVAVHDGDTITVRAGAVTQRIRLLGIDCPEAGQAWSARAKRFTSDLSFGRTVRIDGHGLDRYDRLLARVVADGTDVNLALVRAGLAWQYEFGTPDAALAEAERVARASRVGLWSDPDPVPPWRWRRSHPRGH